MQLENEIKSIVLSLGADVCGIANSREFTSSPAGFSPADIFPGFRSVIVFGIALLKGLSCVPSRLVYGHFNYFLCHDTDEIALKAAKLSEERFSCTAVPLPSDSPYEYWDKASLSGRGLISMKHAAVLAGLGELGKNTLLLNPKYGNRLVLGAFLTDLDLVSDPLVHGLCIAGCRRCIDACPAHAILNGSVDQKLCRENTYHKTKKGFDTVDCNRCRQVCPSRFL